MAMWQKILTVYAFLLVLPITCAVRIMVKECPVTETAWQARSQIFTCISPLVYHCIQNDEGNLMETCMRAYPINPFNEGGCPWASYFADGDSLLSSVFYPCNGSGCPKKNDPEYLSNQLYKYPICLHYNQKTEITDSTTPVPLESTIGSQDVNESAGVIIAIVTTAVVMTILLIFTVLAWKYRKRLNSYACGVDEEVDGTLQHALIPAADIGKLEDHKESDDNFSTELHSLCQKGDLINMKHLINKTQKAFYVKDRKGRSLLHSAGLSGSIKLVQYLIDNGCDVYSKDNIGQTIVHVACQKGHVDLVKHLIDIGKDVLNIKDSNGLTPFHCAGFSGSVELFRYLIKSCCHVCEKNIAWNVSSKGHVDLGKLFIDKDKDVLKIKDNNGKTPFHCAGFSGSVELVQYLIDIGCDVYSKANDGRTIVHIACQEGHANLVKCLIDKDKALLNIKDNNGKTPFYCAGFSGSVELVQCLIDNGCDVYSKNNGGQTILHIACQEGHVKLVKCLIDKDKALLNIKDNNGKTPFHYAGFSGSVELVQCLIDNGCNVYDKTIDGLTIVHIACKKGHASLVKHLITINSDLLKIKDHNGTTPVDCAELSESFDLLDYLRSAVCE